MTKNIAGESIRAMLAAIIHKFWAADVLSLIDDQNDSGIEIETGMELGRPTVFIKMPRTLFENIDHAARAEFKDLPPVIQARFRVTAARMMRIAASEIGSFIGHIDDRMPTCVCVVCGEEYYPEDGDTDGRRCVCGNIL